jgi:hypothetical protein
LNDARILVTRQRLAGEIIPVDADQSGTREKNEELYGAERAIDLNLESHSYTVLNKHGAWLKIVLGHIYCVEQIRTLSPNNTGNHNWEASKTHNFSCVGPYCNFISTTVYIDGEKSGYTLPDLKRNCIHGDTVKTELTRFARSRNYRGFYTYEIAVIGRHGE